MSRFLLYSHDTYGLGHLRRSNLLAEALVDIDDENEVLVVTGSPRAQSFALAPRVDTVKLPSVTKDDGGAYRPRSLAGRIEPLVHLRSQIITSTVLAYEPDVIIVDHAPQGMAGELVPVFGALSNETRTPRLILGLRDIIDEADRVDAAWKQDGTWDDLDRYDDIFVYGDESVTTTAVELDLSNRVSCQVSHTGFVAPLMPKPEVTEPFVLVTPGGGGDGHNLLRRYLDAVATGATAGLRSIVVTGPLLSAGRKAELSERAAKLRSVELMDFTTAMRDLISSATAVISMAGYNTVVEELEARTPALLVPRRAPRMEQYLRATRLEPLTSLEHCALEALDGPEIRRFIERCQGADRQSGPLNLNGAVDVARRLTPRSPTENPKAERREGQNPESENLERMLHG